jgi:hypothetical protein
MDSQRQAVDEALDSLLEHRNIKVDQEPKPKTLKF